MRSCFKHGWLPVLVAAPLIAGGTAGVTGTVTSVVRPDRRTGRLVRTIVAPREARTGSLLAMRPGGAPSVQAGQPSGVSVPAVVEETALRYNLDPLLVHSVIQVESNYDPFAVSPKGAEGLMQLIPATARRFGVRNSFNLNQNLEGGTRYLKHLLTLFRGDERLALAAYNAGEEAVARHKGIPPYRETVEYVSRVGKKYGEAKRSAVPRPPAGNPAAQAQEPGRPQIEQFWDQEGRLHIRTK